MVVVGSGIMAENLTSNEFNILLANTIVTGAGLTALIWIFINISGAHFNPAVSIIMFLNKELKFNHLENIKHIEAYKQKTNQALVSSNAAQKI